ncbi:MAG: alpha/beta hydrolase [Rubritalea sp.]|uniref:alpha/beta hydrolase n=1 Tax=Rubritalea sp. TaxID=2109375 RepID=UPI00324295DE
MSKWKTFLIGELSWKRLAKSFISIYVILLVIAVSLGDYLIFVPPTPNYTAESAHITLIEGSESDSKLATYYRPAKPGMPTLLWSHGNAEDLSSTSFLNLFHQAGFGIYAYDYPGYGLSDGSPSDRSCYGAIERAYEDLTGTHKIPSKDLILVGQSVGSGPTTYLATQKSAAAMVLITPLTSIYRVAFKYPIFPRDRFPNIERIKNITLPLMLIHGDQDEVIPQSHGKALVSAHKGKHVFHSLEGRGHNDIYGDSPEEIEAYIQLFLDFSQSLKTDTISTSKK